MQSPFFEAALKGPWKESLERQVEMSEEDPTSLQIYFHWLYNGKLPTKPQPGEKDTEFFDLVQAYVLGDKILDSDFQNIIMKGIVEKCRIQNVPKYYRRGREYGRSTPAEETAKLLETDIISLAFSSTRLESPLRKLLVDLFMSHGTESLFGKLLATGNIPQSFSDSLARELMGLEEVPRRPFDSDKYLLGEGPKRYETIGGYASSSSD